MTWGLADYDDAAKRSLENWQFAIACQREIAIRKGRINPRSDKEKRWAKEGEVDLAELDTVRNEQIKDMIG